MSGLTFVSLFSGVGGFDLGLERAGWRCVAQVEWDQQCQAVLAHHWPDVPRWSDVCDVHVCRCRSVQRQTDRGSALLAEDGAGARCPRCDGLPHADVVAFGSPCQDLSVAGKRAGFVDGGRSNLFFEAIRIIKEMRDATGSVQPRFVIWENVVGALSSNQGDDFAAVLDALAEVGAVDIGWRVLDARWFGVPQRRRRVFVVADLAGRCAGAVSTEPEGVRWDPDSCGASGASVARGVGAGVADGGDVTATHTHTHTPCRLSPEDSVVAGQTQHTPAPVGWSANGPGVAAPLLVSKGGLRTTDIDGATWVVEQ
jgi:DNA (cytosine-5)-methyltransferase 1